MENQIFFDRTTKLLGSLKPLMTAKITIVGVGGVGGVVAECLARSGVQNLVLIDGDTIDETNLNRQIFTTRQNIGKPKVDEMEKRIKQFNPHCCIYSVYKYITPDNAYKVLKDCDYIIDCIDDVPAKLALIQAAKQSGTKIVSAMGAGNRKGPPNFMVMDIYKTTNDPFAKIFRKKLKELGIKSLDVCVSTYPVDVRQNPPASVMWQPLVCGAVIAAFVINKLYETQETLEK